MALTVSVVAAFLLLRVSSEPEAQKAESPVHVEHDPVPAAQPPEPPLPTVQLTPPPEPEPPRVVHEDPDAPALPARIEPKPSRAPRAARTRTQNRPQRSERPAADKPAARNPADLLGF